MLATLLHWYQRWNSRRQLTTLPENLKRDLGLSDAEIHQAVHTPFWKKYPGPKNGSRRRMH